MGLICFAVYDKQDCLWTVISASGHIVERWPTREQAVAAVARLQTVGIEIKEMGDGCAD